jgi:hypothetical protein
MPIIDKDNQLPPVAIILAASRHREPELTGEYSVYQDSETGVEILISPDGDHPIIRIRIGNDSLAMSPKEWRGLYSGVLNIGPGGKA